MSPHCGSQGFQFIFYMFEFSFSGPSWKRNYNFFSLFQPFSSELQRRPNCLSEDTFLQSLASQLDCALVYRKLGLPLLENDYMKFNDLICLFEIQTTQHQKDLFHVRQQGISLDFCSLVVVAKQAE